MYVEPHVPLFMVFEATEIPFHFQRLSNTFAILEVTGNRRMEC